MSITDELEHRARQYTQQHGLVLGQVLGCGYHGIVFLTESQPEKGPSDACSAIKVHWREADYRRERDVHHRLKEHGVKTIRGGRVPQLLGFDDPLWIIEMTVVSRPFVLDFAGANLDQPPDFSEEVLADEREKNAELFGPRWPEVQRILGFLEGYGIFMLDVNPGNVSFGD
jgi:hypothetical protein